MRRFFVEKIPKTEGSVTITGKEAKHISRVLRMGIGDRFILLDREGVRFEVMVATVAPGSVTVALKRQLPPPPESPVELSIGQALLKPSAMEMMIQKTTELGVTVVYPFIARRSVVRPRADKANTR
ncbi:MAG: RsmE family RNA methyltransferase, partial [Deltaproteobacteria bacterium]